MKTPDNTVLVTGADGFVGRALCAALATSGHRVRMAARAPLPDSAVTVAVGEIGPATDWSAALDGIGTVVHLAARTHTLRETAAYPLGEYRRINVGGSERLARSAAAMGVRRLVFLSSVKVNGESTAARPFTENDTPRPEDAYGISKQEAEQALAGVSAATGLEIAVLRPPLVYGPGVKGNFLRLMRLVARGLPLPLGAIRNQRSLIYVGNLADAITKAVDAPRAAGATYLVADGEDVSTPDLVRELARALGATARLPALPPAALNMIAAAAGKGAEFSRLAGSLQVDDSRIRRELGWRPPYTFRQGIAHTALWYRALVAVSR